MTSMCSSRPSRAASRRAGRRPGRRPPSCSSRPPRGPGAARPRRSGPRRTAAADSEWMFGRWVSSETRERPCSMSKRVGDAHEPGLQRDGRPPAVADDGVQDLGRDDGALGLLVDVAEQVSSRSAARKRLKASWSTRWIDMPRSCSRQPPAITTSASAALHRVVRLDRGRHARRDEAGGRSAVRC